MAVGKGLALATANLLVTAIGIALVEARPHLGRILDMAAAIIVYGGVPGLLTGAVLGWLGQILETRDRRLRGVVLSVVPILVVVVLGEMFDMPRDIVPACIPTIACALALERWTRKLPVPPIPVARARSIPDEARID